MSGHSKWASIKHKKAVTDQRRGAEFTKLARAIQVAARSGGSLGEPGSVAWVFEKKGVIVVDASRASEDDLMVAIDAGAEDVALDENLYEVVTAPADLQAVRGALEGAGIPIESAELTMRPTNRVEVDESQVGSLMRLIEALEEHDDVSAVHANFDVDAAVLERVAAA
jgi:transcriptional/translational regulatory protein YebC/TACO1